MQDRQNRSDLERDMFGLVHAIPSLPRSLGRSGCGVHVRFQEYDLIHAYPASSSHLTAITKLTVLMPGCLKTRPDADIGVSRGRSGEPFQDAYF